jgi:hypothetical protein
MRTPPPVSAAAALGLAALLVPTLPASAQPQTYVRALYPADGEVLDNFGFFCSLRGNIACVGATRDDDGGSDCGAAYLFDIATGQQLHKLVPSDGHANMAFGFSSAVGDGIVAVGAPSNDVPVTGCGAAYLFDIATGQQLAKITAPHPEAGAQLGQSFAFYGDYLFIGCPFQDFYVGRVYVYNISDPTNPDFVTSFVPPDLTPLSNFGISISIDGDRALIGGAFAPNNDNMPTGAAFLYDISDPAAPVLVRKFEPMDGWEYDAFGTAVGLYGDLAIVGAFLTDDLGNGSGSAYLFDANTGQQLSKMLAFDDAQHTGLGSAVGIVGNYAVVGAVYDDTLGGDAGSVYIFDITNRNAPVQVAEFAAPETDAHDGFGISIAFGGDTVVIGANLAGPGDHDGPGAAYVFRIDTGAPCPADWDGSGTVNSSDISAFLTTWLQSVQDGTLEADFNQDQATNSSDISAFLTAWLQAVQNGC